MKNLIAFLGCLLAAAGAVADEAKIRRVVEAALGGVRVDGIQPAPLPGFFEVRFTTREGPQIVYTDADASYILEGSLYDTRAKRNLTEERLRKLSAISFDALPLDLAVKVQRGNGKRVMAMFSDPYCPACRQFEQSSRRWKTSRSTTSCTRSSGRSSPTIPGRCGARRTVPRPGSTSLRGPSRGCPP